MLCTVLGKMPDYTIWKRNSLVDQMSTPLWVTALSTHQHLRQACLNRETSHKFPSSSNIPFSVSGGCLQAKKVKNKKEDSEYSVKQTTFKLFIHQPFQRYTLLCSSGHERGSECVVHYWLFSYMFISSPELGDHYLPVKGKNVVLLTMNNSISPCMQRIHCGNSKYSILVGARV